ncbi:MAG: endonuclease V [Deltaproteobacteria bacterium]|nr:endonuclease V [Deltaproteobacteria bacterium]
MLFSGYGDKEPAATLTVLLPDSAEYIPGQFYRRELPCIVALLDKIREPLEGIIIDGYVMLGDRPGLGMHLFNHLEGRSPVIGVAKSEFRDAYAARVFRGRSERPLYVTAVGMNLSQATERIDIMHGDFRIPTLLKHVDMLARGR